MLGMPFLEFFHGCGFIKQSKFNSPKQVFQVQHSLKRKNSPHGIGWLGSFMQPIQRSLPVQLNGSRNSKWIVSTYFLDEFAIAGSTCVGYYDEIEWSFLRPMSL